MIQATKLSLSFGSQVIFNNISFLINQKDRIGLVGRNGSGKTTLLKSIIDQSVLNCGTVSLHSGKKLAYMPQEVVLESSLSILDETFSVFERVALLQTQVEAIESELKVSFNADLSDKYHQLQQELGDLSPEILKANTKKILMGLGFSAQQLNEPVSSLSVGWKMRIVLAKLLLMDADFYLFDEPTNHLDLIAKEWFLDFLKASKFGFMIICHEKYFLDELCDKIFELERGNGTWYTGNYSDHLVQKEHNLKLLELAYVQQQKEIEKKKFTIARFKASASKASTARSMQKALDKVELIEVPPAPKTVNFSFPQVQQSGKLVVKVEHVSQAFGDKLIFKDVSVEVERGQKVAIVAPNGVGKTTLFNLIAGVLPLQKGSVTFGYNVTHSIFNQDQNKALNLKASVIDNIRTNCPRASEQMIRSFLGAFMFSGEAVNKKVGVLSGGEKNRVGIVSVLLQNANLLLLDEPTNHLDIPSKEILLNALKDFTGTVIFVSHDRDFINELATNVVELTRDGAYSYSGNYDSFVYQKQFVKSSADSSKASVSQSKSATTPASKSNSGSADRELKLAIDRVLKIEKQLDQVNHSFADFEYGSDEFNSALKKLRQLEKDLKEAQDALSALE